ncbi:ATP-binding protein [Sphingobacterium spiritivorum]|uniref:histidine kinase n=1 Tax=Sphingobacterium spiritivorum ATCC 33861 TaxID=525373 RepID=D7VSW7_SPHSI|nr:hybrid sensor histidine kinase/response regulator [Sphingobacterium spiritivorum]EFK56868.1 ATPase/histidine kinase/DNA gyrase B/HSP90 domain protein [Sphingobacterium spiritivorum ATCC 33861]QQT35110.1 response regulator [Sphingobacterium spiritivorum]WQD36013.1 hybrid sensor histidine kinase/response regulator [Sphingobacterium spiritivorum]SUJ03321.1 Autoinducer 2 sensor kinase/phosphatase luxQ [Sphingobacterium spiritivorum]
MTNAKKNAFYLRMVLIISIILSFIFLSAIFIYQYGQYRRIEAKLNAAYAAGNTQSSALYGLFSTFSEADNLFRLYTVDFKAETYHSYKKKLDTIKFFVDSLSTLPIENNPLHQSITNVKEKGTVAMEFANLKRDVDQLVFFAKDSLELLKNPKEDYRTRPTLTIADTFISNTLQDTVRNLVKQDTVVKKKESLFKRIFNTKNDTIVSNTVDQKFNINKIGLIQQHIQNTMLQNDKIYSSNMNNLRLVFSKLRQKERELIQSNHTLLNKLKTGINRLRDIELAANRNAEAMNFAQYQKNAQHFGTQLIIALCIMLFMIIFIIYYQFKVVSYEKRLYQEKEYVAKIAEEKTSVLASISHEIRAPINSLLGVIDLMNKNTESNKVNQELINSANYEITLINSTINDILSLSKLEVGSLNIKYDYFSPYEMLHDLVSLHSYQAQTKGLAFTNVIDIDPKLKIYSNAFRIKQITSNLITNAIKYTKKGHVRLQARIRKSGNKPTLHIEVSDSGIGIADKNKNFVFRKYYMTDSQNKVGGFGLGLYISKLLTEQLNGEISFESTLGTGTTFSLKIPYERELLLQQNSGPYTVNDLPDNLNIVLIDDSRINILYLKQFFKEKKNVHTFENGAEGLRFVQQHPVDIVITDLLMPEISGWDILNSIKENKTSEHIKVFAFTSENMLLEDDHRSHNIYAFDGILNKPLREDELVSTLLKGMNG